MERELVTVTILKIEDENVLLSISALQGNTYYKVGTVILSEDECVRLVEPEFELRLGRDYE